ncbi:MAG: cell wall-binding repeat-containing protein, partial [Eggerthellaceae bacterium]|nr:cell wall-binding repeat-containing protein [Eggerthellaceae bacterium]
IDKDSIYYPSEEETYSSTGTFCNVSANFLDVVYENETTHRVKGGYIFMNEDWVSDGGKLVVQKWNEKGNYDAWEDTSITVTCSKMQSTTDWLIDNYTDSSMSFFEKLDEVEHALAKLSHYPRSVYDESKPNPGTPYPFFATSPYPELSLNEHYNIFQVSEGGLLLEDAYPFILNSYTYPGEICAVAYTLEPDCKIEGYPGAHWMRNITYNGETRVYGSGTPMGNEPIYSSRVVKDFKFDGAADDFAIHGTLDKYAERYVEYGNYAVEDVEKYEEMLSEETVRNVVGAGAWARVASEGFAGFGGTYSYIAAGPDNGIYAVGDAWIDGRYVDANENLVAGAKLEDHPTASIVVRNMSYTDIFGKAHENDAVFFYDPTHDDWRADFYYNGNWVVWPGVELPEQFILTREQVEAMDLASNTNRPPKSGYVYDGTEPPGTPFTSVWATGLTLQDSATVPTRSSVSLDVSVLPSNATIKDINWESSNEDVAAVYSGTLYGKTKGTATIKATTIDGAYSATCKVTVVQGAESIAWSDDMPDDSYFMYVGETKRYSAVVSPADAVDKTITWSVDDESVAKVNSEGELTGLSQGLVTLTATTANGQFVDTWVTVAERPADASVEDDDGDASSSSGSDSSSGSSAGSSSGASSASSSPTSSGASSASASVASGTSGSASSSGGSKPTSSASGASSAGSASSSSASSPSVARAEWKRFAGADAYDTMKKIVRTGFDSCDAVVVAAFDGYWDALAASSLAGKLRAPVLLTATDKLSAECLEEINRLGAKTVYIAGGTAAVSSNVQTALDRRGIEVKRMAGKDALDTAVKVAKEVGSAHSDTCIVATANGYWDALAAGPYAYSTKSPIFLTDFNGELTVETLQAIKSGGYKKAVIAGGYAAVKQSAESKLKKQAGVSEVVRKAGETAYETSIELAKWGISQGMTANGIGIATANGYWDALTGSALCGKNASVLVLADVDAQQAVKQVVAAEAGQIETGYIFGGERAVGPEVYNACVAATKR